MFAKFFVFVCLVLSVTNCVATDSIDPTNPPVEGAFARVFGESDTIYFNDGGFVPNFLSAAKDVLQNDRHIRIDGFCGSSCVIFADKARPNVCITDKAVFAFHMMSTVTKVIVLSEEPSSRVELRTVSRDPMTPLSEDINKWVKDHGGFPYDENIQMDSKEASAFWPMCK